MNDLKSYNLKKVLVPTNLSEKMDDIWEEMKWQMLCVWGEVMSRYKMTLSTRIWESLEEIFNKTDSITLFYYTDIPCSLHYQTGLNYCRETISCLVDVYPHMDGVVKWAEASGYDVSTTDPHEDRSHAIKWYINKKA